MSLRQKKKRDYRQMIDGDEVIQKTVEDEQKEIMLLNKEARDQFTSQYMNS